MQVMTKYDHVEGHGTGVAVGTVPYSHSLCFSHFYSPWQSTLAISDHDQVVSRTSYVDLILPSNMDHLSLSDVTTNYVMRALLI